MGVVDDDANALQLDQVEPAGRFVEGGVEGAKPLADVVQMDACGVGGRGRGQRVLDVHASVAVEGRRQQVDPGHRGRAPSFLDQDHLPAWGIGLDGNGLAAPAHPALHQLVVGLHREEDDRAAAVRSHVGDELIIGIEHGRAAARNGLDDHPLDGGELAQGMHLLESEVVAGHVEDDRHVVALVAEAFAEDAAARHLEDRAVDAWVLQHQLRRARPAGVDLLDQAVVDVDAVRRGHANVVAHAAQDMVDHADGRGLAIGAGDGHDRNARG